MSQDVGFIGLGLMGREIASNLCRAGFAVHVWNRSPGPRVTLAALGARVADSPADVASRCPVVFVCVADGAALREVLLGPDGVRQAADGATLVVDHSTTSPDEAVQIAGDLREACSAHFVDAPVTGGTPGARAGTLVVFAGGADDDVDRARPLVAHSAQRLEHVGRTGAGQAMKMCNQTLVLNTFAVLAETVKLAESLGLDPARLPGALSGGSADSSVLRLGGERAARRDDEVTGSVATMLKDLEILLGLGGAGGVPMPMTAASSQLLRLAAARGLGHIDGSQLVRLYDAPAAEEGS